MQQGAGHREVRITVRRDDARQGPSNLPQGSCVGVGFCVAGVYTAFIPHPIFQEGLSSYLLYSLGLPPLILYWALKKSRIGTHQISPSFPPLTLCFLWLLFAHDWPNLLYFEKRFGISTIKLNLYSTIHTRNAAKKVLYSKDTTVLHIKKTKLTLKQG